MSQTNNIEQRMQTLLIELATNPKIGGSVGATTSVMGTAVVLEWVQNGLGLFATLLGIVATSVVIYTTIKKWRLEQEKLRREIQALKEQA